MITATIALALSASPDTGKHVFFTGDAALVNTAGNTDLTSASVGNKLKILGGRWTFVQTFNVTYSQSHDSVTTELWRGSMRGERALSGRFGLFVITDGERNTFAGVRSRIMPSFGVAGTILAAPRDTLRLELGGGYTWQAAVPPGTDRNYAAGRAALLYRLHLGPRATIEQALEFLPNFKIGRDYRIASETTVAAPITGGIAMKASYVVRYEGVPEPGFKKTDRILVMGIQVTL